MVHILFLITGIVVGFLSGLFGIGGGIIIFPVLYLCMSKLMLLDQSTALLAAAATSLMITIPTLSVAAWAHQKNSNIKWKYALYMLPGIIIGIFVTTHWLAHIFNPKIIKIIFTVSSLLIAAQIYFTKPHKDVKPDKASLISSSIAGAFIGAISVLLGIAGGEYSAAFLHAHHLKIKKVAGTTSVIGLIISIIGSIGFFLSSTIHDVHVNIPHFLGYVYIPAVIQICLTSLIMASFGQTVAAKAHSGNLRRYFAFVVVVTGLVMPFV